MKKTVDKKKLTLAIAGGILAVLLIAFWILLIVIQVNKVSVNGYESNKPTRFIAHRGYSEIYHENTVQSFTAAGEEDFFDAIETDVWMTKDGVFVCSHDVNPFEDGKKKITDCAYDEIKNLPLSNSKIKYDIDKAQTYTIPTLQEYLDICLASQKLSFVEIKQNLNKEQTEKLVDEVYEVLYRTRVYFCSFNRKVIEYVIDYKPLAKVELFASVALVAFAEVEMGYNVGFDTRLLKSDGFVKLAHKKNCFANAWTVETKKEADRLIGYGIDWITCNGVLR